MSFGSRIKSGWNAFMGRDSTVIRSVGPSYGIRPDRYRLLGVNSRTIVNTIYNKIGVYVSLIDFKHARVDENLNYSDTLNTTLNDCLSRAANCDQTAREFIRDVVISMLDEGVVAIVPTFTSDNPDLTGSYQIYELRTGKIVEWYPKYVKVHLYDEDDGRYKDIIVPKESTAIVENPFYTIMNTPNSTLQQLLKTISKLNEANDQSTSGKIDLLVQMPYSTKSDTRKQHAEERRREIEDQLNGSKYGIAYIDGTEKAMQLNRPIDNSLFDQVNTLQTQLFNHLGLTQGVLDGTAKEEEMINFYHNTIEPICAAIAEAMSWKFISRTAYTQGQRILYFRDPFKLVPVSQLADIADKFTRNEIMTSNELRTEIGMKPSDDPDADKLRNKNLNKSDAEIEAESGDGSGDADEQEVKTLVERSLANYG